MVAKTKTSSGRPAAGRPWAEHKRRRPGAGELQTSAAPRIIRNPAIRTRDEAAHNPQSPRIRNPAIRNPRVALADFNTISSTSQCNQHHPAIRNPLCTNKIDPNVIRNPAIRNPRNDY